MVCMSASSLKNFDTLVFVKLKAGIIISIVHHSTNEYHTPWTSRDGNERPVLIKINAQERIKNNVESYPYTDQSY